MNVLAVIVTHNRRDLLARCIECVRAQKLDVPARLFVVDNASSDGTRDMLVELGVDFITQENVGSAGGWHRGIQAALEGKFDAVWLMDDDGYPESSALATLIASMRPGISCVSSVVVREHDHSRFVFPFPKLDKNGQTRLFALPRKISRVVALKALTTDGTYPFAHLFNGALISTEVIRKAGNVNRDYFMFGDEVDYFFRLRREGSVISVLDARHYHPDVTKRPYTPAKIYYYIKNTLILNHLYMNSTWLRNILAVLIALTRTARRNSLAEALSYLFGRNVKVLVSAVRRGLAGNIGRDFNG